MLAKMSVGAKVATMLVVPLLAVIALAVLGAAGSTVAPWVFVLVGIAGIAGSLLVAVAINRTLVRPLQQLATAAEDIADHHLPAAIAWLQAGREEWVAPIGELDVGTGGEFGRLAAAFDRVQQVSVATAQQQGAMVRKGIGDLFVNLTRRNQELLARQIEFIDQLEAGEADPDQLDKLFRLDHLATRMRRNTESLLVLAGAEPPRRSGRPVELGEVLRVAVSEVADYPRIRLAALDDVMVSSAAAVDTAHLLAELLENATRYSPPDRSVEVAGTAAEGGGYLVTVSDEGLGFAPDTLVRANAVLADPPVIGLDLGPSLGFVVVGRIAQRYGITVRLAARAQGGTTATVTLPAGVAALLTTPEGTTPPVGAMTTPPAPAVATPPEPAADDPNAVKARRDVSDEVSDDVSDGGGTLGSTTPPARSSSFGRVPPLPPVGSAGYGPPIDQQQSVADGNPTTGDRSADDEDALAEGLARAEDSTRAAGFGTVDEFELVEEFELLDDADGSGGAVTPLTPEETAARLGSLFSTASMVAALPPQPPVPHAADPPHDLIAPVTSIADAPSRFAGPSPTVQVHEDDDTGIVGGGTPLPSRRPSAGLISRPLASVPAEGVAAEGVPAEGDQADLARPSPRQQLRAMTRSNDVPAASRVAASQRSPEEVRRMLSRYRSGLEQGRSAALTRPERVAAPDEQQPSSDPGSALRAAPPPPPAPGGFEPHHLADADHAERDRPVGEDRAWPR